MILSLRNVSVGGIFVLILLNLFVAPFAYICGILNFPNTFVIFVLSYVYLLCLFQQVKFHAFEADVSLSGIPLCAGQQTNFVSSTIWQMLIKLSGFSYCVFVVACSTLPYSSFYCCL